MQQNYLAYFVFIFDCWLLPEEFTDCPPKIVSADSRVCSPLRLGCRLVRLGLQVFQDFQDFQTILIHEIQQLHDTLINLGA